jgi:nucleotide-binding universal stress UspA family protein
MLPPKLIMVPLDFSEHSHNALNEATELASRVGAQLLVVYVVPAIPKLPSASAFFKEREYEDELNADATKRLEDIVRSVGARGIAARSVVGIANDVGGELVRIAEHNSVDLIVISSHGMTGWRAMAFGSIAEKVVRMSTCPVLLLRVQAEAHASEAKNASVAVSTNS